MNCSVKEAIKNRKSVRTFDGKPVTAEDVEILKNYVKTIKNPFGIPIEFKFLTAKEHGVSSAVIVGADLYLAAKVKRVEHCEIALGYSFEKACLFAVSCGLGTVMLAGSLSRAAFENAMNVGGDEALPVATPIGYPSKKHSLREIVMRKAIKADVRKDFGELFFCGSFDKPLTKEEAGVFFDALDLMRWAPSAVNKQPWRAVVAGGEVHFYEMQTIKDSSIGDIQKVDVGNALCHFDLVMREEGKQGEFIFRDPHISASDNARYIVSYKLTI